MEALYDQYCFSRFTRKNITLSEEELKKARKESINLWSNLMASNSTASRYQMLSNHDIRFIKRTEEKLPKAQILTREKVMEL